MNLWPLVLLLAVGFVCITAVAMRAQWLHFRTSMRATDGEAAKLQASHAALLVKFADLETKLTLLNNRIRG